LSYKAIAPSASRSPYPKQSNSDRASTKTQNHDRHFTKIKPAIAPSTPKITIATPQKIKQRSALSELQKIFTHQELYQFLINSSSNMVYKSLNDIVFNFLQTKNDN
jgi:hypothetical protein